MPTSIHTARMQEAISASVVKLQNRYGLSPQGLALWDEINDLTEYVEQLPDDCIQNAAAKRCLARLKGYDRDYGFKDWVSDVTIKQLLALSWRAIHDETQRMGDLANARARLVRGLYEIQRGHNLSEHGVDDGHEDRPICRPDTFNKLIEPLVGIHPDTHFYFVTTAFAANKLPIVVKEEAMRFLAAKVGAVNSSEHEEAARLIVEMEEAHGCIEPLWMNIQAQVADRMFDEFGSLYPDGKEGGAFQSFVVTGQGVTLEEGSLEPYKQQLARLGVSETEQTPLAGFSTTSTIVDVPEADGAQEQTPSADASTTLPILDAPEAERAQEQTSVSEPLVTTSANRFFQTRVDAIEEVNASATASTAPRAPGI